LRQGVDLYDNLPYDEPWGVMQPSRHILGALTLESGLKNNSKELVLEAEKAYEYDLGLLKGVNRSVHHPNNIWSLIGLMKCYQFLKKPQYEEIKK